MTRKTRRILFYGLVLLFAIGGSIMSLYSRGWRINIEDCGITRLQDCKIQKTGAIFIQATPKGVIIKIDNKIFEDKSGLIQSGTLVTNLLPKSYKVEILKEGYFPWLKNLRVKPELVAEAENIILIPKEIKKESIPISRLRGEKIETISNDNGKFILKNIKSGVYYLYDFNSPSVVFNINVNFKNISGDEAIKRIAFHPFDSNRLIVETATDLEILDTVRLNSETVLDAPPLAWTVSNSNIYYITKTKNYSLYSLNLVVKTKSELAPLPDYIIRQAGEQFKINKISVSDSENKIAFLTNLDDLYIVNRPDKSFQKIAHNSSDFTFSPDNKKIAFLDRDNKLNIFFFEDWDVNNPQKAGETLRFLLENRPLAVAWHKDSAHLLLTYPNEIKFMEIDDRLPNNSYRLLGEVDGSLYYDQKSNFIYFLEEKSLYRIQI